MSGWLPETLKARALLIVFSVFILSHFATLLIYESNRTKTVLLTEATDLADRIIGIVLLANSFPDQDRQRILAAAQTQFVAMFPELSAGADEACEINEFSASIDQRLKAAFAEIPGVDTSICLRSLDQSRLLAQRSQPDDGVDVLIFVHFPDGQQAAFHAVLPPGRSLFQDSAMSAMIVAALIALLLAWYLIRKTVAPIERLSLAADAIGTNIDVPALDERGPREVALAAKAFNRMQGRLARLIHGQTEMLAAISHDLRSAITRLQLRVDLLKSSHERDGMIKVVTDMRRMIQSVVEFSRGQNPGEAYRKVNIGALIESLCEDLVDEGLPVSCDSGHMDIHLPCRVTDVRRALNNVIDNAVVYGGSARVSYVAEAAAIIIAVEDSGPGIPEADLHAVVQPFFRLERSRNAATGGIGLGLAIAQNIVQAHGGQLLLRNLGGGGLRVEFIFPLLTRIA